MTRTLSERGRMLAAALAVVGWAWLMSGLGTPGLLWRLGAGATALIAVLVVTDGAALRPAFACERRALFASVVAAAAMVAVTFGGYPVALTLWPGLGAEVAELYRLLGVGGAHGASAAWLLPIIVAEELFFRGTLWRLAEPWPRVGVVMLSVVVYALAQFGSGNLALLLLSLVCGAYWALWRAWSGSLWPSLVSHLAWNLTVLVLWPLAP